MSERELAAKVVAWLVDSHWTVYQEVSCGSCVADIVATQGPLLWVIECKKALSLAVMEQAHRWRGCGHLISVATPRASRRASGRAFAEWALEQAGIGTISVAGDFTREETKSRFDRRPSRLDWMRSSLREQQKTYAPAGSAHGGHWTPFKETCDSLRRKLQAEGAPMRLKDLIASVRTHYQSPSTARACLRHWIEQGKVGGVRIVDGMVSLA